MTPEELRQERDELTRYFEMRIKADMRAIERWKAADPKGREAFWPDHSDMVTFLLEQIEKVTVERNELATDRRLFVPGVWSCEKCGFELSRTTLNVANGTAGTTATDREESEPCPNDGTELKRVSWEGRARDLAKTLESFFDDPMKFWPYVELRKQCSDLRAALDAEQALTRKRDVNGWGK